MLLLHDSRRTNLEMENFIVSARKYRPSTFNTVVGQQHITNTLKNAIRNNQLAQAFLFCGPRGVGKTTCARIFAKTINCEHPTENIEPCNECTSCRAFNESSSFNVHELDAASNNGVDDIRSLVDQVRIPPQMGAYKVYIIDEVHMLSLQAFNAFLKTLEEPPAYAKFILATTEKHKIIPTILSRCQIFDFKRITVQDIAEHLAWVAQSEQITAERAALDIIAQKADGAMRDSLSIFDQMANLGNRNITYPLVIENLNVLDYDYYFRLIDHLLSADIQQAMLLLNDVITKGFDGQHFITGLGDHLRNLMMAKDPSTVILIEIADSIRQKYVAQAQKCSLLFLVKGLELVNKCDAGYRAANNKRLSLEITLMRLTQLNENQPVASNQPIVPAQPSKQQTTTAVPPQADTQPVQPTERPQQAMASAQPAVVPQSNPSPQSIINHPMMPSASGVSLKDLEKKTANASEEAAKSQPRIQPFTFEQLESHWNDFAQSKQSESTLIYTALTQYKPVLEKETTIVLKLEGAVLEREVKNYLPDLLELLRNKLQNDQIIIETVLVEKPQDETRRPYTDRERYEQLNSENPNVSVLRDQLDLGIE